jgi:hypothetical protein
MTYTQNLVHCLSLNKVLLEHSHVHLFIPHLCLMMCYSGRTGELN